MTNAIGQRLKAARKAKGYTQTALAKATGLSQGTIGNLEAGLRDYGLSVIAIAAVLGTSPQYLRMETDIDTGPAPVSKVGGITLGRVDSLQARRQAMAEDLGDMLARFKTADQLRAAYARCVAAIDGMTPQD